MRFVIVWLCVSFILINTCVAQDSLRVKNETTIGFLMGEHSSSTSFQHYSGIFIPDYNVEAGVILGFDKYEYFNINPVGLALKKTILNGKKIDMVLGFNAGLGVFFFQNKEEQTTYKPQLFTNPNLSFRFGKDRKVRFNVNVGYKIQKARITSINSENIDFWGLQPDAKVVRQYNIQRIVVGLGVNY